MIASAIEDGSILFANDSDQARRFAKAMRASLIFSSTSHSINVQKVIYAIPESKYAKLINSSDFQDRSLKGVRPQMHHS